MSEDVRPQPHALDAEKSVLGAILLHEEVFDQAAAVIAPPDFWRHAHGLIFEAMTTLRERASAVDFTTLAEHLAAGGNLDAVGGRAYIASLTDGVPRAMNVEHHARIVKEKAIRRQLMAVCNTSINDALSSDDDVTDLIGKAQQAMCALGDDRAAGFTMMKDLVSAGSDELDLRVAHKGTLPGLPTGFSELDGYTCGLQAGDLIILAARPSMGKTSLALNIAEHVGLSGRTAAVFSLEMSKRQLFMRMLSGAARVDAERLKTGRVLDSDWPKIAAAMNRLSAAHIFIDDSAAIGLTEIGARCRRLASEHGLDLVVIDYLQLMRGASGRYENRQVEVSQLSRGLKVLAKELGVPIIVLSQLSRAPDQRTDHRPQLSDLRESGAIEQDADVVLFVYRAEQYHDDKDSEPQDDGMAEIIIGKQRNGPTETVRVAWLKRFTRFENLAHDVANHAA